jgi:hypothetical protein
LFSLIPSQTTVVTKKLMLQIDSTASAGSHGKYMKNVSFPWPPVVKAHDRKRLARALQRKLLALEKLSLYSGLSYIHQVLPFTSNCAEDDTDQNRVCCDNQ